MRKITVFLLLCCIGWLLSARAADSVKNTNNGVLKQSVYIDFGKNNGLDGNVTEGPDQNGHYWNNAIETEYGETLELVSGTNESTGFIMEITKKFLANGIRNGGLLVPDQTELGDLAISTATQDYFYIEGAGANGSFRIKNLNKNRAYRFYVFGSRAQTGDEERIGYLSFTGSTGSHGTYRMTGKAIGTNGENQNTGDIYVTDYIFPDFKGEVDFQLAIKSGGFAHINAMKIEEYGEVDPLAVKQDFYIDFGRSDGTNGHHTIGADVNNHYWNNAFEKDNFTVSKGAMLKLVNSANVPTGVEMKLGSGFRSNGRLNGGLLNPDVALLGDLAIETATEDYIFIENGGTDIPGIIDFNNLNPKSGYRFHVFGCRDTETDRMGLFTFSGENSSTGTYKMGGKNSGGNGINHTTDRIYVSDVVYPDANGSIRFNIDLYADKFAHINAMKIEECTNDPVIKATSITLTGQDITESGQTSQIQARVLPEGAIFPAIRWSVDDESIARVDNQGIVYPKTNGKVKVTASIVYDEKTLSDEIEINISGQLGSAHFTGTAVEEDAEMQMITDLQGTITNLFEIYTSLKGTGSFSFYRDLGNDKKVVYGKGKAEGSLMENGEPIQTDIAGPVRISIDLTDNTYEILPITSLNIVGTSTSTGADVTKGLPLEYQGKGIWAARLTLNGGDPKFNFIINKDATECLKRIKGTNRVVKQSQGESYGMSLEDIRTNMNGGEFYVEVNLRKYTYAVSCGETEALKISYMGSSVANGSGTPDMHGYAYMYTQLLTKRHEEGRGLDWKTSNISIGGNTTANLLDRWERDLLSNCSSYVIYGLSLGNEGVHDRGEAAYNSYRDGMLQAIKQAEDAGIVPVMANNYTRADYNESDYNYVKKLNLLIHEWDLPSINTLGAIDDGKGRWASGYENDAYHPNSAGHQEFCYAIVPSLFDALEAGKPLPKRVQGTSCELGRTTTSRQIEWIPEETVHPFTVSFDINTTGTGTIAWFENESGNGFFKIKTDGTLVYESPLNGKIQSETTINTGGWKRVTLTHYYAWGNTILYIDDIKVGELPEKLSPKKFVLGSNLAPDQILYRELFFWRSGMNTEEIAYVNQGKMMKSSLEIYAPLGGDRFLENLAQSTNELEFVNAGFTMDQKLYIDFGKDDGTNGNITGKDTNGNFWNNAVKTAAGTEYSLVNSYNQPVDYKMHLTTGFLSNGIKNGGLLEPDTELLGDFAINTATQDYFFIEENNGAEKGGIDFKNLKPEKAYKFYVFGSRYDTNDRTGLLTFTGTNSYQGTHQMGGANIAEGDITGNTKNQNNNTIFVSEAIYPDVDGTIHFELARYAGKFAHINAMKIEEYSVAYASGTSPIISTTPADGMGVRIARIHSASGGFNNEGPENLLLDKNVTGNGNKKWCYNSTDNFVIIELSDYYDVDKFVIEDCKTREPNNPNLSEYHIYVSTAGTSDADWKEVVHEINQSDVMYKVKEITPVKARYIKLVPKISSNTVRIYGFKIYGRKSFDSVYENALISVGKPVIMQQDAPNVQNAPVALFDGEMKAANSKWSTSTAGDKSVVVDLKDNYAVSGFKLYDAGSVDGKNENINGYILSVSQNLSDWEVVEDANNKADENIKEVEVSPAKVARYIKLEVPADRLGTSGSLNLYEFNIFGKLDVTASDASLLTLQVEGNSLMPVFEAERTVYSVKVAKEIEKVNIKAEARNPECEIGGDLGEKSLILGENDFFITVKSADRMTERIYTVKVYRADKSAIAGIESLSIEGLELEPDFSPSTHLYRMETKDSKVVVAAKATSEYARINGIGKIELTDGLNELNVEVISEDGKNRENYTIMLYNTSNLLSVSSPDGKGKRIVNIDSYSGMTGTHENPFRLLRGWKENLSGDNTMKWCDTSAAPFIIFSLTGIYTINHIEFRDCKMVESGWANVPGYSVYVSTTDTLDGSWTEIIRETGVASINEKVKSFDPVDARFVKFVPSKGDNAVRIYGFDIYGQFKEAIDRNGVISVGKTILNCSAGTNDMLTAANALDGREGTVWEFTRRTATLEVDLEEVYSIDGFALTDSLDRISGYKVAVSRDGVTWETIAEKTFEDINIKKKVILLEEPVDTRYVRLTVPGTAQRGTTCIKEFEVYESGALVGIESIDDTADLDDLLIWPNPVSRGTKVHLNGNGHVSVCSLQGILIAEYYFSADCVIPTDGLKAGIYIVRLDNGEEIKTGKLIVK